MSKLKQLVLGAQRARQQSSGRGVVAGMRGVRWVGLGVYDAQSHRTTRLGMHGEIIKSQHIYVSWLPRISQSFSQGPRPWETSALHCIVSRQSTGPVMPVGLKSGGPHTHPALWGRAHPLGLWWVKGVVAGWVDFGAGTHEWQGLVSRASLLFRKTEATRDMGRWANLKVLFMLEHPGERSLHCPWCSPSSPGRQPFSHFMAPRHLFSGGPVKSRPIV